MLKSISSLGTTLSKKEQKVISGGFNLFSRCHINSDCYSPNDYIGPDVAYCDGGYCQLW